MDRKYDKKFHTSTEQRSRRNQNWIKFQINYEDSLKQRNEQTALVDDKKLSETQTAISQQLYHG